MLIPTAILLDSVIRFPSTRIGISNRKLQNWQFSETLASKSTCGVTFLALGDEPSNFSSSATLASPHQINVSQHAHFITSLWTLKCVW